jgi:hypothetical protein
MQIQDDDFPYTSDDPSLTPFEEAIPSPILNSQQVNDLKAALRLVVGSTLNGSDILMERLRRMQAMHEGEMPQTLPVDENETPQDQLRYLLLGALFELPDLFQRSMSSGSHFSSKIYDLFSRLTSPLTDSWLFKPVRDQYDQAAARGERVVDRLIRKGRMEEYNSRQVLQQKAIDDLINEFVEYLVIKIKVQEIIQREGASVAGDVVGEFRQESANVDDVLENKLKSIFRKDAQRQAGTPPGGPAEGG